MICFAGKFFIDNIEGFVNWFYNNSSNPVVAEKYDAIYSNAGLEKS